MRYRELLTERKKKRQKTKKKSATYSGWYGYGIADTSGVGDGGGVEEAAQLGAQDKINDISPVLGSKKPKKQKQLMNKFFGSS